MSHILRLFLQLYCRGVPRTKQNQRNSRPRWFLTSNAAKMSFRNARRSVFPWHHRDRIQNALDRRLRRPQTPRNADAVVKCETVFRNVVTNDENYSLRLIFAGGNRCQLPLTVQVPASRRGVNNVRAQSLKSRYVDTFSGERKSISSMTDGTAHRHREQ